MKPIGLALAAAMLAAGMAAPAAAHSPGEVLVIRGNQVSAAGPLEVKALGAGDAIWFVEPDSGRLVACHLRNSVKAGRRVLRCWSGQERY
jgi:hypothetical protein